MNKGVVKSILRMLESADLGEPRSCRLTHSPCVCVCGWVSMCVCVCVFGCVCVCVCLSLSLSLSVRVRVCVCACATRGCVCARVHMCVCVYACVTRERMRKPTPQQRTNLATRARARTLFDAWNRYPAGGPRCRDLPGPPPDPPSPPGLGLLRPPAKRSMRQPTLNRPTHIRARTPALSHARALTHAPAYTHATP